MRETLIAARWLGPSTGNTYRALFNANDADDALRLRKVQRAPEFKAVTVEIDFDPAQSGALNRPPRELVEAERDRLAALLVEARAALDDELSVVLNSECVIGNDGKPNRATISDEADFHATKLEELLARIDAALPQPVKETAA